VPVMDLRRIELARSRGALPHRLVFHRLVNRNR
jgi:hypothetical protein